jgi:hypothetical protein
VQSWSFAFMYDVGWSLRRARGVAAQAPACAERGQDEEIPVTDFLLIWENVYAIFPA